MMKEIQVCSRKRDERTSMLAKYVDFHGNVMQRMPVVKLGIDIEKADLHPLAKFLCENIDWSVSKMMKNFDRAKRVRCFAKWTDEELLVRDNGRGAASKIMKVYNCTDWQAPAVIEDWLFDVLENNVTAEQYWNNQALKMIRAGVVRVQIGRPVKHFDVIENMKL